MIYYSSSLIFFKTSYIIINIKNNLWYTYYLKNFLIITPQNVDSGFLDTLNASVLHFYIYKKTFKYYFLVNYYYNIILIFWTHIIFKGKSYQIRAYKKYNKLTLNFGYSHWSKIKFNFLWGLFKRRRQNYVIYGFLLQSFYNLKLKFPYIKVMNRYTLRGLRLRKQKIKKRFGKISQYLSSMH